MTPGGASSSKRPLKKSRAGTDKKYKRLDKSFASGTSRSSGLFNYSGDGPFPNKLATTLLYRSVPVVQTGSAGTGTYFLNVVLNDLFDFDYSNVLGNKQPLFYDQLFGATGPYQRMECKSWRTRITVINQGSEAVSVYWNGRGTANSVTEEDTLAEVTNRPYMIQRHLAPKGSSGDRCYIKSSGRWSDHNTDNVGSAQAYNSSPSTQVFGTLFCNTPTTTTAPNLIIQVDHYFDIVALRIDASSS